MKKIVLIILAIVIVLGVGGYFTYTKLINRITLNPNCKYNDPDLCKFINGWKEVKYYTYTSNTTDKDGKKSNSVLKMAGTGRTQMTLSEEGKESYNVITIDKTTYTKDYSDNKWWKVTTEPVGSTVTNEDEKTLTFDDQTTTEDKTTYKKIGTEACGKLTCFKYQMIDPSSTDSKEYIYFDNKEYQLRKTRSEMSDGSVSESTIDYSKISITEPTPVKEGNPTPLGALTPTTVPTTSPTTTVTTPSSSTPEISEPESTDQTTDTSTDTSSDSSADSSSDVTE